MSQTNANGATFMEKLSTFIVDKRNLIFLITIIGLIFSAFSRNWVQVENDLTFYLPDSSQTKQALAVMDELRHGGGNGGQRHTGPGAEAG